MNGSLTHSAEAGSRPPPLHHKPEQRPGMSALLAFVITALIASALPVIASIVSERTSGAAGGTLVSVFKAVLPFAIFTVLHFRSGKARNTLLTDFGSGLLTATLLWTWVTVDTLLFPNVAGIGIASCSWITPAVLCAMLASSRMNSAMSI